MSNPHKQIFKKTVGDFKPKTILDAGSGCTSLSILCEMFPSARIDAVIFPGDIRKRDSVARANVSCDYELIEVDIAKMTFSKTYDLVIAHLLLGEATKWGNSITILLKKLFPITKHLMIADFPEDPEIDFTLIEKLATESGFNISKDIIVPNDSLFIGKSADGTEWRGSFYKAILLKKA